MRAWILVLIGSLLLGSVIGAAAPATWTFRWTDGALLGLALYAAALRRYVDRREACAVWDGGATRDASATRRGTLAASYELVLTMLPGLLFRTALFAAILALQATLCFDLIPNADVRRGFVVLSAWVVMLSVIDTGTTEASRPLSR